MNLHVLAADLARRRKDLAAESAENAEQVILGLLQETIPEDELKCLAWLDQAKQDAGFFRGTSFDTVWAFALDCIRERRAFRWQPRPPEPGLYWWWNGQDDSAPIPLNVHQSGHTGSDFFVSAGQYGIEVARPVADLPGIWAAIKEPNPGPQDLERLGVTLPEAGEDAE